MSLLKIHTAKSFFIEEYVIKIDLKYSLQPPAICFSGRLVLLCDATKCMSIKSCNRFNSN